MAGRCAGGHDGQMGARGYECRCCIVRRCRAPSLKRSSRWPGHRHAPGRRARGQRVRMAGGSPGTTADRSMPIRGSGRNLPVTIPWPGPPITARSDRPATIVGTFAASGPPNYPRSSGRRSRRRITARSARPATMMGRCAPSGVPNDPSSSRHRAAQPITARSAWPAAAAACRAQSTCSIGVDRSSTRAGPSLITARSGGVPLPRRSKP